MWNEYIYFQSTYGVYKSESGNKYQRPNLAKQFLHRNFTCYYGASDYKFKF